jgi:hypothetical protein
MAEVVLPSNNVHESDFPTGRPRPGTTRPILAIGTHAKPQRNGTVLSSFNHRYARYDFRIGQRRRTE